MHIISPENDASESPLSNRDSIIIEGKRSPVTFNVHQLIATTIVASFTEMNLHLDQNLLIPVIMICVPQAKICFYDCENDLLIMSETFNWVDHGKLRKLHILLVWLAIYHSCMYVLCYDMQCILQRLCKEGVKTIKVVLWRSCKQWAIMMIFEVER